MPNNLIMIKVLCHEWMFSMSILAKCCKDCKISKWMPIPIGYICLNISQVSNGYWNTLLTKYTQKFKIIIVRYFQTRNIWLQMGLDIILLLLLGTLSAVWFPPSTMEAGNKLELMIATGRIGAINFPVWMEHIGVLLYFDWYSNNKYGVLSIVCITFTEEILYIGIQTWIYKHISPIII